MIRVTQCYTNTLWRNYAKKAYPPHPSAYRAMQGVQVRSNPHGYWAYLSSTQHAYIYI